MTRVTFVVIGTRPRVCPSSGGERDAARHASSCRGRFGVGTCAVSANTHYFGRNLSSPTFANVCVNGLAGAQGRVNNGVFNANQVKIWAPKPPPVVSQFGIVVSVNGSTADGARGALGGNGTFTLMNRDAAPKVVNVTTSTTSRAASRRRPSQTCA